MKRTVFDIINAAEELRDVSRDAMACALALICIFNKWANKTAGRKARDTRRVLCAVDGLNLNEGGVQWQKGFGLAISTEELARATGCNRRTFYRLNILQELERANFVQVIRRRGAAGNVYFLTCGEKLDAQLIVTTGDTINAQSIVTTGDTINAQSIVTTGDTINGPHSFSLYEENVCEESACVSAHDTHTHVEGKNLDAEIIDPTCEPIKTDENNRPNESDAEISEFSNWYKNNLQNVGKYISPSPSVSDFVKALAFVEQVYKTNGTDTFQTLQRLLRDIDAKANWHNKITLTQAVERFARYDNHNPNKQTYK